jgi:methylmalonyl-CoA mutase
MIEPLNRPETIRPPAHAPTTVPIRIVTAGSLFDGHDAAINLMRRLMQASGAEVIHLGHNRSVEEIVSAAVQEDAQAVAVTSYQGGHLEFFRYLHDLLRERGATDVRIFGGGGGTILPHELEVLHAYGITRLYSPDDGRALGLQGMIDDLLARCDQPRPAPLPAGWPDRLAQRDPLTLGRLISWAENRPHFFHSDLIPAFPPSRIAPFVLGITGPGGAGKSSVVDELVLRFRRRFPPKSLAVLSVDPSKRKTGGALLGDRIRLNAVNGPNVFVRSMATRQAHASVSQHLRDALAVCRAAGYDWILLETSGIGQSDTSITELVDFSLYVMTAEYGAATQLEKIDMLDFADAVVLNKFDKPGSPDALRDVRRQLRRARADWETPDEALPVFGTQAAQFNDGGVNALFEWIATRWHEPSQPPVQPIFSPEKTRPLLAPERNRYLADIVAESRKYAEFVEKQTALARRLYQLDGAATALETELPALSEKIKETRAALDPACRKLLDEWPEIRRRYAADTYEYAVRGKTIRQDLSTTSLSGTRIPKVSLPRYTDWGDLLRWRLTENLPGEFPYTSGVFPLKREGEAPARMFAGEGLAERTNRRFHYLSRGQPAKRLSTAFDSVTLYGENPDPRPDIWGKVGNSGVNVCTLDDARRLYSGFDLCDPSTSVSMTINGPAPIILAMFLNAAIDQQVEKASQLRPEVGATSIYRAELPEGHNGLGLALLGTTGDRVVEKAVYEQIKAQTLRTVRGTVQADILKEDQAQNTCIFSTEFALRLMGDIQEYFIQHQVRNFYSVSVSGYHIAEAGANPITQLAFTLANGITLVEYYLSRGMAVDEFAPNLSFFFSNGMDPEYTVLGRVARRIWAKAMRFRYGANERSQKLKYHIQTSGRSLHAQEIAFNDIRTTLQALTALMDNANSLHTNAYDEAITTPTEESVRRALAIQLIINQEFGLTKTENPLQGSFVVEELTDLVEEAVYQEFLRLNERGGVMGAMERMYQRGRIQDESMEYELRKHTGHLPIVGVNTFLDPAGSPTVQPREVIRSSDEEKRLAVEERDRFQARHADAAPAALRAVQEAALSGQNTFAALMEAVKVCTLGQLTHALYEVGGQYRRNM